MTGYIRNNTVNCDYLVCSRNATVRNLTADIIEGEAMTTLLDRISTLETKLERLNGLENRVDEIDEKANKIFTAGASVATTLHFDNVDLDDPTFNLQQYQQGLIEAIANASGMDPSAITILDLASTGSATARIEINYETSEDNVNNEELDRKRRDFQTFLNNPDSVSEALAGFGSVQVEEVQEGSIQSVNSKLFSLERQLTNFSLENTTSLQIDSYKLEVVDEELTIRRYDYELGAFVGGTMVLD